MSAFDMHRVGSFATKGKRNTRRCLTVKEMRALGMVKNANGAWTTGVTRSEGTGDKTYPQDAA